MGEIHMTHQKISSLVCAWYAGIITLFSSALLVCAQNNQELFLQAVQAQQNRKYDQAFNLYEQIQPKGWAVFYNVAHIYYDQKKYASALAYLLKAQRQAGMHDYSIINDQISIVYKQLGKPEMGSSIFTFTKAALSVVSLLFLQLLFLVLFFILLWMLKKRKRGYIGYIIIFSLILPVSVGLFVKGYAQRYTGGVIIENEVPLRVGPQDNYEKIGHLPYAQRVIIQKQVRDWYLVQTPLQQGWVSTAQVIPIE
jgi:tetratricopeptide (TPR) repeat protein